MSILDRIKGIQLFQPKTLYGVELNTSAEELKVRYIEVCNSYGRIKTKSFEKQWLNVDDFIQKVSKNNWIPFRKLKPCCLIFSGSKVVFRSIEASLDLDNNQVLQSLLPGAKPVDFFVDSANVEGKLFGAAIKKDLVEGVLELLNNLRISVFSVGMGPLDSFIFADLLSQNDTLYVSDYQVNLGVGESQGVKVSVSSVVKIDNEEIPRENVLGLSAAIKAFQISDNVVDSEVLQENQSEIKYWNYLITALRFVVVVGLFLIGTGYFLIDNYEKALIELSDATAEQTNSYRQFEKINTEYKQKVTILSTAGLSTAKKTAAISDKIGIILPDEIRLTQLEIYPLEKSIKKNKRVLFDRERVFIQGISPNSSILNEWLITLKDDDWIKEVTILNYSQTNRENPGLFEIDVKLNE